MYGLSLNLSQIFYLSDVFSHDVCFPGPTVTNNCCSSTESTPRAQPIAETTDKGNHSQPLRGEHFNSFVAVFFLSRKVT